MRWVLVWSVLVVAATIFLGLLGRRLWRQAKALGRELSDASLRMDEASEAIKDTSTY